jgi:uncharacterized Zn finger protein (UPF0148 family)
MATYLCPKGHQSTDPNYCSECGALIGQSVISKAEQVQGADSNKPTGSSAVSQELCPDCGTPRTPGARFCEVCRHDFQENKAGVAEAIVASQQEAVKTENSTSVVPAAGKAAEAEENTAAAPKLNVVISVDRGKASASEAETAFKPDTVDKVFPLDLNENLVGRRSASKGIYPEIVINDPGVSHRQLMFIKKPDGSFAVLELGSSNGTELNGAQLEPGVITVVKAGDELAIGMWTIIKLVSR